MYKCIHIIRIRWKYTQISVMCTYKHSLILHVHTYMYMYTHSKYTYMYMYVYTLYIH